MQTQTSERPSGVPAHLLNRAAANDVELDGSLTASHLELVRRIAGALAKRLPTYIDRNELIALGNLGLVEARARFDSSRGVPFSAFAAMRIRGAMLDGLRNADPLTRDERARVRRDESTNYPVVLIELDVDLHAPSGEAPADEAIEKKQGIDAMRHALAVLSERERLIVTRHFLEGQSLKGIGEELGVTESRICQIVAAAVARLRGELGAEAPAPRPRAVRRAVRPATAGGAGAGEKVRRNSRLLSTTTMARVKEIAPLAAALRNEVERPVPSCRS